MGDQSGNTLRHTARSRQLPGLQVYGVGFVFKRLDLVIRGLQCRPVDLALRKLGFGHQSLFVSGDLQLCVGDVLRDQQRLTLESCGLVRVGRKRLGLHIQCRPLGLHVFDAQRACFVDRLGLRYDLCVGQ